MSAADLMVEVGRAGGRDVTVRDLAAKTGTHGHFVASCRLASGVRLSEEGSRPEVALKRLLRATEWVSSSAGGAR